MKGTDMYDKCLNCGEIFDPEENPNCPHCSVGPGWVDEMPHLRPITTQLAKVPTFTGARVEIDKMSQLRKDLTTVASMLDDGCIHTARVCLRAILAEL